MIYAKTGLKRFPNTCIKCKFKSYTRDTRKVRNNEYSRIFNYRFYNHIHNGLYCNELGIT